MRLFRFIMGVLGVLLIIGAFSSFFPLVFLGGIASGSVVFALGFPIFLIVLGATMVYFGFYYKRPISKSNSQILEVVKWGVIYTIAILLAGYVIGRLMIVNTLLVILLTAIFVSILAQIVRSHYSKFNLRWFVFYFLVYSTIIWVMSMFILTELGFKTGFFSSFVLGFVIAGAVSIIQKISIKHTNSL